MPLGAEVVNKQGDRKDWHGSIVKNELVVGADFRRLAMRDSDVKGGVAKVFSRC